MARWVRAPAASFFLVSCGRCRSGMTERKLRPPARPTTRPARRGGGVVVSGFSVMMLMMIVLAVLVLAPTVSAYVAQRRQILELQTAIAADETTVQQLQAQRDRWNDTTYIITQARERLYYVRPGEVSYLVIDDRPDTEKLESQVPVSAQLTTTKSNWMLTVLSSVVGVHRQLRRQRPPGQVDNDAVDRECDGARHPDCLSAAGTSRPQCDRGARAVRVWCTGGGDDRTATGRWHALPHPLLPDASGSHRRDVAPRSRAVYDGVHRAARIRPGYCGGVSRGPSLVSC